MSLIPVENTEFETKIFDIETLGEYDSIKLFANADVFYNQSSDVTASIQAPANIINDYDLFVRSKTLYIASKNDKALSNPPKIQISGSPLKKLTVEGVGSFQCLDAEFDNTAIHLKGSGSIILQGTANSAMLRLSGNGIINAKGFVCNNVKTHIAGNGAVMGNAKSQSVSIVNGAGETQIYGDPTKETSKVDGQGIVVLKKEGVISTGVSLLSPLSLPALNQEQTLAYSDTSHPVVKEDNNKNNQSLSVENMIKIMRIAGGSSDDDHESSKKVTAKTLLLAILLLACIPALLFTKFIHSNQYDYSIPFIDTLPILGFGIAAALFLLRMFYLSGINGRYVLSSLDTLSLILLGVVSLGFDTIISVYSEQVFTASTLIGGYIPAIKEFSILAPGVILLLLLFTTYFLLKEHVLKPFIK